MNTNATKMKNILASCFISEDPFLMKIPTFAGGRIFRNRTNIKTAWLIQHTALFAKIRPLGRFDV